MKVKFLGTTSSDGDCPTVYATDRGTYLVQGDIVTDPEALAALRSQNGGLPEHETVVEIPAELVRFFPERS